MHMKLYYVVYGIQTKNRCWIETAVCIKLKCRVIEKASSHMEYSYVQQVPSYHKAVSLLRTIRAPTNHSVYFQKRHKIISDVVNFNQ